MQTDPFSAFTYRLSVRFRLERADTGMPYPAFDGKLADFLHDDQLPESGAWNGEYEVSTNGSVLSVTITNGTYKCVSRAGSGALRFV